MRKFANERGEPLMTPVPVVGHGAGHENLPMAAGDEWSTQAVLVNPTDREISGTVVVSDDRVNYHIPAGSAWRLTDIGGESAAARLRIHRCGCRQRSTVRIRPDVIQATAHDGR